MQHNIKKIKEILVPYTAEENAELSGGEDTVPPPLPPRRRRRARRAPRTRRPLPQRTPQTEAEGRAAMKAYKEAWEKANAEAANRPITQDNPAGDEEPRAPHAGVGVVVRPRPRGLTGRAPLSLGVPTDKWGQPEFRPGACGTATTPASLSSSSRRRTSLNV